MVCNISIYCWHFTGRYARNYLIFVIEIAVTPSTSDIGTIAFLTAVWCAPWLLFLCSSLNNQKKISNTLRKLIPVKRPNIPPKSLMVQISLMFTNICDCNYCKTCSQLNYIEIITHIGKIISYRISKLFLNSCNRSGCKLKFYHSNSSLQVTATYISPTNVRSLNNLHVSSHKGWRQCCNFVWKILIPICIERFQIIRVTLTKGFDVKYSGWHRVCVSNDDIFRLAYLSPNSLHYEICRICLLPRYATIWKAMLASG